MARGSLNELDAGGPTIEEKPLEEAHEQEYRDEIMGALLDPKKVQEAMALEIEYMMVTVLVLLNVFVNRNCRS